MTDPTIRVQLDGHAAGGSVATVTIDNAARLNCLNSRLMGEFAGAMAELSRDARLRAVVVTGAGEKAFVGGADIDEMAALDVTGARAFITRVHRCCAAVRDCPVPVIARINGHALGAGLELAASCDLRVAVAGARLGMPEVRLGIPSVVEAALLPTLVGWGRARQILLLGETFSATQAAQWGLVEQVVGDEPLGDPAASASHPGAAAGVSGVNLDALDAAVARWVDAIAAGGPHAIRQQKALIRQWEDMPLRDAIAAGIDRFARAYETDEPATMFARFRAARGARKAAR